MGAQTLDLRKGCAVRLRQQVRLAGCINGLWAKKISGLFCGMRPMLVPALLCFHVWLPHVLLCMTSHVSPRTPLVACLAWSPIILC